MDYGGNGLRAPSKRGTSAVGATRIGHAEGCSLRLQHKGPLGQNVILPAGRTAGQKNGQTEGRPDGRKAGRKDGWTEGQPDGRTAGRKGGRTAGRPARRTEAPTDSWTDNRFKGVRFSLYTRRISALWPTFL